MQNHYPPFTYIYRQSSTHNPLLEPLCAIISRHRSSLEDIRNTPYRKSIEVERMLKEDLAAWGFCHSVTNKQLEGLFPDGVNFEIDFYHPDYRIAVEVEKGEINNVWKNICKFAESPLIGHGVLVVPIVRNKGQENESQFYVNTIRKLHKLQRIYTLLESLVVIGY